MSLFQNKFFTLYFEFVGNISTGDDSLFGSNNTSNVGIKNAFALVSALISSAVTYSNSENINNVGGYK